MRWIFYTLLMFNGMYFAWGMYAEYTPGGAVPAISYKQTAGQRLMLLGESRLAGYQEQGAKGEDAKSSGQAEFDVVVDQGISSLVFQESLCASFGPFEGRGLGNLFIAKLGNRALDAKLVAVEVDRQPVSWLYLPVFSTYLNALRRLQQLQVDGVEGYIVTTGGYRNAISFGYFADFDSARGYQMRLIASGVPVQLLRKDEKELEFWALLPLSDVGDVVLADVVAGQSKLKQEVSLCRA